MHGSSLDKWVDAQLDSLAGLEQNWDSYEGLPIDPKLMEAARTFLKHLSIVPMSNGGVQVETHALGWNLEFSFEYSDEVEGEPIFDLWVREVATEKVANITGKLVFK